MMKKIILSFTFLALLSIKINAQDNDEHRSCSVVCLNQQWIPSNYDHNAKTALPLNATGKLSVHETWDVADQDKFNKEEFVDFKVAILKSKYGSLISFSNDTYRELSVQEVLQQCEKGDQIFILLTDMDHYSLPHYKIDVL